MGTWGAGNLDNDYALDELATRSAELIESIMTRARSSRGREADEYDYTTLFIEFEILFAFKQRGLLNGHTLPLPDEVEILTRDYIAHWDGYIDGLGPKPDHKRKRRQTILRTFRRFQRICAEFAEEQGRS